MGTTLWIVFGLTVVVMLVGVVGTVVPILPGIPLIWAMMLVFAIVEKFERIDPLFLVVTFVITAATEVADQLGRAWGARRFGAGKAGTWGSIIGGIGGLFFLPVGLVLGPFLGVLVAELLAGRSTSESIRAGWGGLIGALGSMGVKLVVAFALTVAFVIKVV